MLTACSGPAAQSGAAKADGAAAAVKSKWEGKLVRRPGPTPEDGKVYVIRDGQKRWVLSSAWMQQNGYKWPDDVNEISAEELAQFPTGANIE